MSTPEQYTPEQFVRSIKLRGYPGRKQDIQKYLEEHPKQYYSEEDLIDYYYQHSGAHIGGRTRPNLCADGQDSHSPSAMKNSTPNVLNEINWQNRLNDKAEEEFRRKEKENSTSL